MGKNLVSFTRGYQITILYALEHSEFQDFKLSINSVNICEKSTAIQSIIKDALPQKSLYAWWELVDRVCTWSIEDEVPTFGWSLPPYSR